MRAPIQFHVRAPDPDDHLFDVEMTLRDPGQGRAHLDVHMPVWSPGSYLVREYPRHLQRLRAADDTGQPRQVRQLDKATWRVECEGADALTLTYEVFSHELAVRTNHLDATHGSFNGVALFLYHPDFLGQPVDLQITPPDGWQVFCGLERTGATSWRAPDFDTLFDSPVEMGPVEPLTFQVEGVEHRVVIWGQGDWDAERLTEDMARIVRAHAEMFGGLPYEHYTFIVHLTDQGRGGLEHHNSTILLFPRDGFRDGPPGTELDEQGRPDDSYLEWLRLVSHEFFHVWNVKRIRPARLGPFDYQRENYTRDLWTVEGVTSYYENIGLLRAGLLDGPRFLKLVAEGAHKLAQIPGRHLHSLEDASFNAWVKLYRPDEHTRNSSVSYYLKGELVCFVLDAAIRAHTGGERSFDDVLLALWEHYQDTGAGYDEGDYGRWIQEATGFDPSEIIERYVRGAGPIAWDEALVPVGLRLERSHSDENQGAWLGARTKEGPSGGAQISAVMTDSPAQRGGLYAGDELIALGRRRIGHDTLDAALRRLAPSQPIRAHVWRRGVLTELTLEPDDRPADTWRFVPRADRTETQRALLRDWLGDDLSSS